MPWPVTKKTGVKHTADRAGGRVFPQDSDDNKEVCIMKSPAKKWHLYGSRSTVAVLLSVLFLMAGVFVQNARAAAYDVTISSGTTTNGAWSNGNPDIYTPNAPGATVSASDIVVRLGNGSVGITTSATGTESGDIIVNTPVSWNGAATLTLQASRNIDIYQNITATGSTAGLVLTPNTGGAGGSFNLYNSAVITLADPPTVTTTAPASAATDVAVNKAITAIFSESMLSTSITSSNFTVSGGADVAGTVTYNPATLTATFTPITNLTAGTVYTATISAVVTDATGIALVVPHVWSFTTSSDATPPVTTASPSAGLYNTTQNVSLSCSDDVSGCQKTNYCLGAGCTPDQLYSGAIAIAASTDLRFYSFDNAGNQENWNTLSYTFDLEAPQLSLSTLPDAASTNNPVLNVSGLASDNSGIQSVSVNGVIIPLYDTQPAVRFSYPVPLNTGSNAITTVVTDYAGNQVSLTRNVIFDTSVPTLGVRTPSDLSIVNSPSLTLSGTVPSYVSSVQVSVNSGSWTAATVTNGSFSMNVTLDPGWNTVYIEAAGGGKTKTVKRTVLYSDTQPSLTVLDPSQDIKTNKSSMTVSGKADPAATVDLLFNGTSYPQTVSGGIFSTSFSFGELGTYTLVVSATTGTYVSSIVRNAIYDTALPAFAVNPVITPTNQDSQSIGGILTPGSSINVTSLTASVGAVTYPSSSTWKAAISGMREGPNKVTVQQRDSAGAIVGSVTVTIELDTKAPYAAASLATGYYGTVQTVSLSADEPATIYYTTDGSDPASSATRAVYSSAMTINSNTILTFYAVDPAGNASTVNTEIYSVEENAVFSQTVPSLKSIITGTTVSYALKESVMSGTITVTWTGGVADSASPYVYTLSASELTTGSHTIDMGLSLKESALYTVAFEALDLAGFQVLPVKNNMVFFDSDYGKGPVGNIDNTGASANRVDGADTAKMNSVMGSRPGDSNWNPSCDLNKDNKIDEQDAIMLQMHYGESSI